MQPTSEQVERSLADLRHPPHEPEVVVADDDDAASVPEVVAAVLSAVPAIRSDAVDRARRRLEAGEQPTDDELAEKVVGRLVCDRLR
jgi:hypothetical protein